MHDEPFIIHTLNIIIIPPIVPTLWSVHGHGYSQLLISSHPRQSAWYAVVASVVEWTGYGISLDKKLNFLVQCSYSSVRLHVLYISRETLFPEYSSYRANFLIYTFVHLSRTCTGAGKMWRRALLFIMHACRCNVADIFWLRSRVHACMRAYSGQYVTQLQTYELLWYCSYTFPYNPVKASCMSI